VRLKPSILQSSTGNSIYGSPAGIASRWFQILPDEQKLAKVHTSQKKPCPPAINGRRR
jgi:hypothetical protein